MKSKTPKGQRVRGSSSGKQAETKKPQTVKGMDVPPDCFYEMRSGLLGNIYIPWYVA